MDVLQKAGAGSDTVLPVLITGKHLQYFPPHHLHLVLHLKLNQGSAVSSIVMVGVGWGLDRGAGHASPSWTGCTEERFRYKEKTTSSDILAQRGYM